MHFSVMYKVRWYLMAFRR